MRVTARRRSPFASICLTLAALAASAAAESVPFDRAAVRAAARALAAGEGMRVSGVPLSADLASAQRTFELERFEVFAPQSRIVVHTEAGERILPRPDNVYLRGWIDGDPDSRVVLSVLASGEIRGLATTIGRTWLIGSGAGAGNGRADLRIRELDGAFELEEPGGGFRCALDELGAEAFRAGVEEGSRAVVEQSLDALPAALTERLAAAPAPAAPIPEGGIFDHTAVIAIETDQEYLAQFGGDTGAATDYIGDLVAFASSIYTAEVQTSWAVGDVSLWTAIDPWVITTPSCGLLEFGRYWNLNHSGTVRTLSHFLSGKAANSGIAWVGVLCSGGFSANPANFGGCPAPVNLTGTWGGGYGFTSGIDGNFDIDSPSILWDIMAFTHEIGHNFNSPHTHCFQGLEGNAAAIDHCYGSDSNAGCYVGSTALPSGCPGTGQNCGTIMSYCHLISPGMSNSSLTLGVGHPYGVQPGRVPTRMRNHVVSRAASNPSCLAPINAPVSIFANGFQSGNTSAWSVTAP